MRSTGVSFLLLLALSGACSSSDRGLGTAVPVTDAAASAPTAPLEPTPREPEAPAEPTLASVECSDPPDADTACFELTTAADRGDATHGTVTLPVMILRAHQPALQPVVIPGGGPGFPATTGAGYWADHALRTDHDIVLYDQRGTGGARPSLECPERDEEVIATLQSAEPPPTDRFAIAEASLVCRARLEAEGIDLNDYDTASSAADLDELRAALGYDRWTILGISYGSRLALESMRTFPGGLSSVILDSVYDVDQGGLAATIDSGERAISVLTSNHPGLADAIDAARLLYNTAPWAGEVDLDDGNGPQRFVITGDDLIGGLFSALYDTAVIPLLPDIVRSLANGDSSAIGEMLRRATGQLTGAADAMQLSVDCADNAGLGLIDTDAAAAEDPGRMTLVAALSGPGCGEWDVSATRTDFNEPVISDIPALVLAGEYDPITPPEGTRAAADRLANSTYVEFAGFGHGITGDDLCATGIEVQFLIDPTAPLDTSCAPDN